MKESVKKLVNQLPEVYQNIFGYPEFDAEPSRNCNLRKEKIIQIVQEFQKRTGKKDLRILDIGCAQGFYSFSLAEIGCTVDAVDYLSNNIELCCALQEENGLACNFQQVVVSREWMESLKEEYDVVLVLSVIHHIANEHGFHYARNLLELLSGKTGILITEMALKEEPLYWNDNLPVSYNEWFENIASYCKVGDYETHLSEVNRPLLVSSGRYVYFNHKFYKIDWYTKSAYAGKTSAEGKRYYICENKQILVKVFQNVDPDSEKEIINEISFLQNNGDLSFVPEILDWEISETRISEIQKICFGRLLSDMMSANERIDYETLFSDILDDCVELERRGLYHKDIHPWNICISEKTGKAFLIDFGNTEPDITDDVVNLQFRRPAGNISVFDSFIAMVYDCLTGNTYPSIRSYGGYHVSLFYDFSMVEDKFRNFMMQCMLLAGEKLSFATMRKLYHEAVKDGQQYDYSEENRLMIQEKQLRALDYQKVTYIEFLEKDVQYVRMLNEEKMICLELQGQVNDLREQIAMLNNLTKEMKNEMQKVIEDSHGKEREMKSQINELQAELDSINQWIVLRGYKKIKRILRR